MHVDTKTVCGTALLRVSHHPAFDAVRRIQSSDAEVWIPLVIWIVRYTPDPIKHTCEPFIRLLQRNSHNILNRQLGIRPDVAAGKSPPPDPHGSADGM
jgi:hypothetical protein